MLYRCNDCGGTFESPHTNYAHAKGYHPSENPKASKEVAEGLDHCVTCQLQRDYDPVAARTRDLANAAGTSTGVLDNLNAELASLKAQVEQAKVERAAALDLGQQLQEMKATLASLKSPSSVPAPVQTGA